MSTYQNTVDEYLSEQTVRWVEAALGSEAKLQKVQKLLGATSSTLYRLEMVHNGANFPLVLRRYTNAEWLAEEPSVPKHEADALRYALGCGAPVPELIAFDETGAAGDTPALLMTCLPGQVVLNPQNMDGWLRALAEALLPIHALLGEAFPYTYWHYYDLDSLRPPSWSAFPRHWERAIEHLHQGPPAHKPVFIHRDYHPVNTLWGRERISGIVDWANACHGALNIDVAHCRANLIGMYGLDIADRFLNHCQAVIGPTFEHHPYWDVNAIAEWDLEQAPEVYPPWLDFGLQGLTPEILVARQDEYIAALVNKL